MSKTNKHTRKMKNVHIPIFCIFITLFCCLTACSSRDRYPEAMRQATHCLEDQPDSALCYLSSLDATIGKEAEETRMYHALLKLRAEDKLYIDQTSDSLIMRIVAYYDRHGDADKRLEAYYMLGRVYRTLGDAPRSLRAFQTALEIGEGSARWPLLGRIHEQMNYLFAYQELYPEALRSIEAGLRIYQDNGFAKGVASAWKNKARIFDRYQQVDSMAYYYQLAYETALSSQDTFMTDHVLNEYISAYMDHGMVEEGAVLIHRLPKEMREENPIAQYSLGMICLRQEKVDSAWYYFQNALRQIKDNLYLQRDLYRLLSGLSEKQGDLCQALYYARESSALKDSIADQTHTEALQKIHSLYNYQHIEEENNHLAVKAAQTEKWVYRAVFIIFALVLLVFLLWHWSRKQEREAEALRRLRERQEYDARKQLSVNMRRIAELEELLRQERTQKDVVRQRLERLSAEKEALELDNREIRLQLDEQEIKDLRMRKTAISGWFHTAENWDAIHENSPQWQELEERVNEVYPAFSQTLRHHCPKLKISELHVCLLVKIGIPVGGMARIMDLSKSAISNIRTRLYEKIFDDKGSADDFDRFILRL